MSTERNAENDAGYLRPTCPRCGTEVVALIDSPDERTFARIAVAEHKRECG